MELNRISVLVGMHMHMYVQYKCKIIFLSCIQQRDAQCTGIGSVSCYGQQPLKTLECFRSEESSTLSAHSAFRLVNIIDT